jgi:hypothetical protein
MDLVKLLRNAEELLSLLGTRFSDLTDEEYFLRTFSKILLTLKEWYYS